MTEKQKVKKSVENDLPPANPIASGTDLLLEGENDGGTIQISENVIAAVVRRYALEVDGVVRFAASSIVGGLAEMIGKKSHESNTQVAIEDDIVSISVTLVLEFGVRIPEVAGMVQDVVRSRVEELTGKQVVRVNVLVQDLEDRKPSESTSAVDQEIAK